MVPFDSNFRAKLSYYFRYQGFLGVVPILHDCHSISKKKMKRAVSRLLLSACPRNVRPRWLHGSAQALQLAVPAAASDSAVPDLTGPEEAGAWLHLPRCCLSCLALPRKFEASSRSHDANMASPLLFAAISASASSAWKGVRRFYARASVARVEQGPVLNGGVPAPPLAGADWHQVLLDGRALRTPLLNDLLVPSKSMAVAIAAEFASQGEVVLPATTPLYSLASTAIDSFVHEDLAAAEDQEAEARAAALAAFDTMLGDGPNGLSFGATDAFIAAGQAAASGSDSSSVSGSGSSTASSGRSLSAGALTSSGAASGTPKLREQMREFLETDSVCYRCDWDMADPSEKLLRRRQDRYYDPLLTWFKSVYGVQLAVAVGFGEAEHPPTAYDVAEDAVDTASPWLKAVLQSVVGATKSSVLTLALAHRQVDVEQAWEAARVEEEWQIGEHGFVEDGHDTARAQLRSALTTASTYLWMLPPSARPAPLPSLSGKDLDRTVARLAAERAARVGARRQREEELVRVKRRAMQQWRKQIKAAGPGGR